MRRPAASGSPRCRSAARLGARVLATASSAAKLAVAREHGAEHAFDYSDPGWVEGVKQATGGKGADVIYDPVGGEIFDQSMKVIAFSGRLLVIGFASGTIPTVPANRVLLKNISIVGLHWGAYRTHDPGQIAPAMQALFRALREGAGDAGRVVRASARRGCRCARRDLFPPEHR